MSSQRWHRKSKPSRGIVPISRFVTDNVFALKNGGYGCMLSLVGIDEEGLTDQEIDSAVRRIYDALLAMPEGGRLYQYVRVRKGFEIPRKDEYPNPIVEGFVKDRIEFLNKNAHFHRIELFWCLTVEPKRKPIRRTPAEYALHTTRAIAKLTKTMELLKLHLGELLGLQMLVKNDVLSFFSFVLNLEEWSLNMRLSRKVRQPVKTLLAVR